MGPFQNVRVVQLDFDQGRWLCVIWFSQNGYVYVHIDTFVGNITLACAHGWVILNACSPEYQDRRCRGDANPRVHNVWAELRKV